MYDVYTIQVLVLYLWVFCEIIFERIGKINQTCVFTKNRKCLPYIFPFYPVHFGLIIFG